MYLLDTNAWIDYLNRPDSAIRLRIEELEPAGIVLCDIVKAELFYGAYRSNRPEHHLRALRLIFGQFASLAFDEAVAETFGRIRADLAAKGTPIGPYDLIIASVALTNGATVVTHNTGEFSRVNRLQVEDWQIAPLNS
jgi:tRNA(fMet)-specific endonuclease VapC